MKKILLSLLSLMMLTACSSKTTEEPVVTATPNTGAVESFDAEYVVEGSSYTGDFKDTYVFKGETTDGVITSLDFDIIRNKGTEGEYSKKDLMGYMMNVADASVEVVDGALCLTKLNMYGFDSELGQFMTEASLSNITADSTLKDLEVVNFDKKPFTDEQKVRVYQYLASEGGITLTIDTKLVELLGMFDLVKDGEIVEGVKRVSYPGYNGGRSYGEQIDAIKDHILASNMTLEDVVTMFETVNQQSTPIEERDTITGATIAFIPEFQEMVKTCLEAK